MAEKRLIEESAEYIRKQCEGESSGHDWWHIYRVWNLAKHIGKEEQADLFVVELGALLHDIADSKFHNGDETVGPTMAREWLQRNDAEPYVIAQVVSIVEGISFKGAQVQAHPMTLEGRVVQDADRLDALGAIGIARVFAYGGYAKRTMHDPDALPVLHESSEAYKHHKGTTLNHFYEKLLLLKDRMNTETGKRLAQERHAFMEAYLQRFYAEWDFKG